MKLLLVIFLVTAAWLLGLYCAQIDGFPDLLGQGKQTIQQMRQGGGDKVLADTFAGIQRSVLALASPAGTVEEEPLADQPSGQLSAKQPQDTSDRPLPVPDCW